MCCRLERSDEVGEIALRSTAQPLGGFDGNSGKAQRIARPPMRIS